MLRIHRPDGCSRTPAPVQLSSCVSPGIVVRSFLRPDPSGQRWSGWRCAVDLPGDVVGHLAGTRRDCRRRSDLPLRLNRVFRHSFGSFAYPGMWAVLWADHRSRRVPRQQPDQESARSRSSVTPDTPSAGRIGQMSPEVGWWCATRGSAGGGPTRSPATYWSAMAPARPGTYTHTTDRGCQASRWLSAWSRSRASMVARSCCR